ncbi:protein-glutamate O-methyltransferase CheR [Dyella sp. A6]|uniref:CheR family methyltransferase n=1 Tax=Dyella aluminiiresistens TaxID=3069105 RepID=UPI002E7A95BE|nr:protein-glutamate O-methyltransferase CheR [Dyella sp. A6]
MDVAALIDAEVDQGTRRALFARVRQHTGIAMPDRKWALLHGRLRRRLQALSIGDYRDYLSLLESSDDEVARFVDLVTTNETSFFRTPRIWEYLQRSFLPAWVAQHGAAPLRVWSAASSSGEEVYSLAMTFEEFRRTHPVFRWRIVATDISQAMVQAAQSGQYSGRNADAFQRLHPDMAARYFESVDDKLCARASLRAGISFRQHNLFRALIEPDRFDLVLLRNVLIYFDEADQQRVLELARSRMAAEGTLIIGESESLGRLATGFVFHEPLIYRNGGDHARHG